MRTTGVDDGCGRRVWATGVQGLAARVGVDETHLATAPAAAAASDRVVEASREGRRRPVLCDRAPPDDNQVGERADNPLGERGVGAALGEGEARVEEDAPVHVTGWRGGGEGVEGWRGGGVEGGVGGPLSMAQSGQGRDGEGAA